MMKLPTMRWDRANRLLRGAVCAALGLALAGPAAAGALYSWRTEDGAYAFTDDPKRIPARYRQEASRREMNGLRDYERFTPQDAKAADRHATRLAARLAELRRAQAAEQSPGRPARGTGVVQTLALRTGGKNAPKLELDAAGGSDPIVVETLFTRPAGKMVTRQSVVVRQGDDTLAVVKPRLREWNVADDIHAEAEWPE